MILANLVGGFFCAWKPMGVCLTPTQKIVLDFKTTGRLNHLNSPGSDSPNQYALMQECVWSISLQDSLKVIMKAKLTLFTSVINIPTLIVNDSSEQSINHFSMKKKKVLPYISFHTEYIANRNEMDPYIQISIISKTVFCIKCQNIICIQSFCYLTSSSWVNLIINQLSVVTWNNNAVSKPLQTICYSISTGSQHF